MLLGSGVPAVVVSGSSVQSSGDDDGVGKSDECVVNNGPGGVTVEMGDEEVALEADGGVVLLDYGCTPATSPSRTKPVPRSCYPGRYTRSRRS